MNLVRLSCCLIATVFIISCSRDSDTTPETPDPQPEDTVTVTFPQTLLGSERKGAARIFANGQEIADPAYAAAYAAAADEFYFDYGDPPKKIQFDSADTLGIFYNAEPAKFGIHKQDTVYYLRSLYPMSSEALKDSNMVDFIINAQTGMYHAEVKAYGNYNEFRIPVFSFRRTKYVVDAYGNVQPSVGRTSYKLSAFKESYISTLGERDTFAIQQYEIFYKKYD